MNTIDRITIHHVPDVCQDLSHLGRYSSTPGPADRTVDRKQSDPCWSSRQCRYFIATMSGEETGNPDSVRQDYERMEAYNRREWYMVGIYTVAEISYDCGDGSRRIDHLRSGGLWGIESDSGVEHIADVEQKELANLRKHLTHFNVDLSNWDDMMAKAMREERS